MRKRKWSGKKNNFSTLDAINMLRSARWNARNVNDRENKEEIQKRTIQWYWKHYVLYKHSLSIQYLLSKHEDDIHPKQNRFKRCEKNSYISKLKHIVF